MATQYPYQGADDIELLVDKPVVTRDVPAHGGGKLIKAGVRVVNSFAIDAGSRYVNFSGLRLEAATGNLP
jgi:hypothetical protein